MIPSEMIGLFGGAVLLGAVHGVEPGHGWPVAASYALDQGNKWLHGFAASFLLGFGHLVSSIAMVAVFFYAKSYFSLTQINEPYVLIENFNVAGIEMLTVGGPVSLVAGVLLIGLGLREYYGGGHSHDHGGGGHDHGDHDDHDHGGHDDHDHDDHGHDHDHGGHGDHDHGNDGHSVMDAPDPGDSALHADHDHDDHDHGHDHDDHDHGDHAHSDGGHDHGHGGHDHSDGGIIAKIKEYIPFMSGGHDHDHGDFDQAADRGLLGIAWFAFVLGFAHEEEFEIIALCAGSNYCLELMSAYAITVIVGIVGLTLLLIAGYHSYEDKVKQYTPYLPLFSAVVLVLMGLGFITGLF